MTDSAATAAWPPFPVRQGLTDRLSLIGFNLAIIIILAAVTGYRIGPLLYLSESHQFLSLHELAHNLGQALWHLISQPPGYNLLIGLSLKISTGWFMFLIWAWHLAWGWAAVWSIYGLARLLSGRRWPGLILGGLLPLLPDWLLYQAWPSYTFPVMAYAITLIYLTVRFHRTHDRPTLIALVVLLNLLMLTRAVYHLLFGALFLAGLVVYHRRQWRRLALIAVLPTLLLSGGWYVKNYVQYGFFGVSSWYGFTLIRVAGHGQKSEFMRQQLADTPQAYLYDIWRRDPGMVADVVDNYLIGLDHPAKGSIPVLDDLFEQELDGSRLHRNLNNLNYLLASRDCAIAAGRILRDHPELYFRNALESYTRFCWPATKYGFLRFNRQRLEGWARAWESLFFGPKLPGPKGPVTFLFYLYPLVGLWLAVRVVRGLIRRQDTFDDALIGGTLIFVVAVCSTADLGENNRLSFLILPLFWTTLIGRLAGLVKPRALSPPQPEN